MIEIIYGGEQKVPSLAKNLMAKMLDDALKLTKQTAKMEVNFALVSAGEIRALNAEFRKVDKATDVLSFPSMSLVAGEKLSSFVKKPKSLTFCIASFRSGCKVTSPPVKTTPSIKPLRFCKKSKMPSKVKLSSGFIP